VASPVLTAIRGVHSAILLVMLGAIGWLVVSGARGRRDRSTALAAALVGTEIAVYVANDRVCPLTPLAERHGAVRGSVSDIWLPDVLARTLPAWSGALVALAAVLHLRSWAAARRAGRARPVSPPSPAAGPAPRAGERGSPGRP
jgi:hypothetical protein